MIQAPSGRKKSGLTSSNAKITINLPGSGSGTPGKLSVSPAGHVGGDPAATPTIVVPGSRRPSTAHAGDSSNAALTSANSSSGSLIQRPSTAGGAPGNSSGGSGVDANHQHTAVSHATHVDPPVKGRSRIVNRRRTNINPLDISRATNETVRKNFKTKPSKVYQKRWTGTSESVRPSLKDTTVTFAAHFDKPMEQLIYPSLQLIEHEKDSYTEQREQYAHLHGHVEGKFSSRFDAHFPMPKKGAAAAAAAMDPSEIRSKTMGTVALGSAAGEQPIPVPSIKLHRYDSVGRTDGGADDEEPVKEKRAAWSVSFQKAPMTAEKQAELAFTGDLEAGESFLRSKLRRKYADVKAQAEQDARIAKQQALMGMTRRTLTATQRNRKFNVLSLGTEDKGGPEQLYQRLSEPLDPLGVMTRKAARYRREHDDDAIFARIAAQLESTTQHIQATTAANLAEAEAAAAGDTSGAGTIASPGPGPGSPAVSSGAQTTSAQPPGQGAVPAGSTSASPTTVCAPTEASYAAARALAGESDHLKHGILYFQVRKAIRDEETEAEVKVVDKSAPAPKRRQSTLIVAAPSGGKGVAGGPGASRAPSFAKRDSSAHIYADALTKGSRSSVFGDAKKFSDGMKGRGSKHRSGLPAALEGHSDRDDDDELELSLGEDDGSIDSFDSQPRTGYGHNRGPAEKVRHSIKTPGKPAPLPHTHAHGGPRGGVDQFISEFRDVDDFGLPDENDEDLLSGGTEPPTLEELTDARMAQTDLLRIRRAVGSKYVGYDYPEIMGANASLLGVGSSSAGSFATSSAMLAEPSVNTIALHAAATAPGRASAQSTMYGGGPAGGVDAGNSFVSDASGEGAAPRGVCDLPLDQNFSSPYDTLRQPDGGQTQGRLQRPQTSLGARSFQQQREQYAASGGGGVGASRLGRPMRSMSAAGGRKEGGGGQSVSSFASKVRGAPTQGRAHSPLGFANEACSVSLGAGGSMAMLSSNATVVVDADLDNASPKAKHRYAQDVLLLAQLKAGILPEQLIASGYDRKHHTINIDISHYGLGDEHGKCLGLCIGKLDRLNALCIADNRLTSQSVPVILENCARSLLRLDLSQNDLHGGGAGALTHFFSQSTRMVDLNVSACCLSDDDVRPLMGTLSSSHAEHRIKRLNLSHNRITASGMGGVKEYLLCKRQDGRFACTVTDLNLAWNDLQQQGALIVAAAITTAGSHCLLHHLNLTANALSDEGGQRIAASLLCNKSLVELNMAQNALTGRSCFVFARAIKAHPSIKRLDLSENPLSDEGACSLFRQILLGLHCFVIMRDCTLAIDHDLFSATFPANASPYTLDLSKPYDSAVLHELTQIAIRLPSCHFESITHKVGGREQSLFLHQGKGRLLVRNGSSDEPWEASEGTVVVHYKQTVTMPSMSQLISQHGCDVLKTIIVHARSPFDRKKWLKLFCNDMYCSTSQAQSIVDELIDKKIIGAGGLTKVDVVASLWPRILDTENKYDFLCVNLAKSERSELTSIMTFEQYKFNWVNPTGRWRIDLGNKLQRSVMMQLIAINNVESEFSRNSSRRGDTSQKGNWFNFRNEKLNNAEDIVMDKEFLDNLPHSGMLEFDYVSTSRPTSKDLGSVSLAAANAAAHGQGNGSSANMSPQMSGSRKRVDSTDGSPGSSGRASPQQSGATSPSGSGSSTCQLINKEVLEDLLLSLGLSSRKKLPKPLTMTTLIELQIASAKFYFPTHFVLTILYTFDEDPLTQAKVVVCLFSRIWDLWNFEVIARQLSTTAMQEVVNRIGWLNLMNPLKPSHDYTLCLKHHDNRVHVVHLLDLCAAEGGDALKELPGSELTVVYLFGKIASLSIDTKISETVRIAYCDFGETSQPVLWSHRRETMKKYLVGTYPVAPEAYECIAMYQEMANAGTLTMGPIDMQYQAHLKVPKQKRRVKNAFRGGGGGGQAAKAPTLTSAVVSTMRSKREGDDDDGGGDRE